MSQPSPTGLIANAIIEVGEFERVHRDDLPLSDVDHARRCGAFALVLFDALRARLELNVSDRPLALMGAYWHDVGYARDIRDHQRKSFDMILATPVSGLTELERRIVACAARYHRRSLPNIEHAVFGTMSPDEQRRVRRLSGIVRLAVALDASHLGLVNDIEVGLDEDGVLLTAHASAEAEVERDRLRENASAFTRLTYVPARCVIVVHREMKN